MRYNSTTEVIDQDTGEVITEEYKKNEKKFKTIKIYRDGRMINENTYHTTYTRIVKKENEQLKLF